MKKTLAILLSVWMLIGLLPLARSGAADTRKMGDADNDGNITAADARLTLRCAVGLELWDDITAVDMIGDGKVTAADARCVLRLAVGLDDPALYPMAAKRHSESGAKLSCEAVEPEGQTDTVDLMFYVEGVSDLEYFDLEIALPKGLETCRVRMPDDVVRLQEESGLIYNRENNVLTDGSGAPVSVRYSAYFQYSLSAREKTCLAVFRCTPAVKGADFTVLMKDSNVSNLNGSRRTARLAGTYTVSYDANGGKNAPAAQTKQHGQTLTLSTVKPTKSFTVAFDANGGRVSPASETVSCTFRRWTTEQNDSGTGYGPGSICTKNEDLTLYAQWANPSFGLLPTPTRDGYTFAGWFTAKTGGVRKTAADTVSADTTLYAHWDRIPTYTVSYDANGGKNAPAAQTKRKGETLTLSAGVPTKTYTLTYNANGGTVAEKSKTVSAAFVGWNTDARGFGDTYQKSGRYAEDKDAVLYAQWTDPKAGKMAIPTRSGYSFDGWYTRAEGGVRVQAISAVTQSRMLYAHWIRVASATYNLGEETYGFPNYGDGALDRLGLLPFNKAYHGGHCFGMSITSAGVHMGILDPGRFGAQTSDRLYRSKLTQGVHNLICYYNGVQSYSFREEATVAGGSAYLHGVSKADLAKDWQEVVAYVSSGVYNDRGQLQIGLLAAGGGHAVNFLRFRRVNGQDRIYVYDNNFPELETYFFMSGGRLLQEPQKTFDEPVISIAVRDVFKFYQLAQNYDPSKIIVAAKDTVMVPDAVMSLMETEEGESPCVIFELPEESSSVKIVQLTDGASFEYAGETHSFGSLNGEAERCCFFEEAVMNEEGAVTVPSGLTYYYMGDVDLDEKVTPADARLALRRSVRLEDYEEGSSQFLAADADMDGGVTSADARLILRVSVGLEEMIQR